MDGLPEKVTYTRYYEHDGMLRAYANRAMVLALMFGAIAIGSLAFAVYVRLQPPTVVRVEPGGDSTAVSPDPGDPENKGRVSFHVAASSDIDPDELESKAIIRRFLSKTMTGR